MKKAHYVSFNVAPQLSIQLESVQDVVVYLG